MDEGVEAGACRTLHKFPSRGQQRVVPGSTSTQEGSQDLLSLCWPPSVYIPQLLPRGGQRRWQSLRPLHQHHAPGASSSHGLYRALSRGWFSLQGLGTEASHQRSLGGCELGPSPSLEGLPRHPWGLLLLSAVTFEEGLTGWECVGLVLWRSQPSWAVYLWFGVLSETGSILPSQLQRATERETKVGPTL